MKKIALGIMIGFVSLQANGQGVELAPDGQVTVDGVQAYVIDLDQNDVRLLNFPEGTNIQKIMTTTGYIDVSEGDVPNQLRAMLNDPNGGDAYVMVNDEWYLLKFRERVIVEK